MNSDRFGLDSKRQQDKKQPGDDREETVYGMERSGRTSSYAEKQRRSRLFLILLAVLLLLSVLLSLWAGAYEMSLGELIKGIWGKSRDERINIVVQNIRLPRICTAVTAGAGLGVAGCILQAVLHNPLASASTLGVSQGAGFGAAFAIIALGAGKMAMTDTMVSGCAFVGSMMVALLVLGLSRFRQISSETVILAGTAISAMFTGGTALLQYFADEVELAALVFWTFGDLGNTSWKEILPMAVAVSGMSVYFIIRRWDYNVLLSGEETAISLGIRVHRMTLLDVTLCSFMISVIVSHTGLINFIGLAAPHIVRKITGSDHVYVIPGSLLAGAILLLAGDLFSRSAVSPVVLPIGAVTSFLGGPIFLYLLFGRGRNRC